MLHPDRRARDPEHLGIDRLVSVLFRVNAVINWSASLPGLVSPTAAAAMFGGVAPNYASVVRVWQGLVCMFGWMFWEASNDVRRKAVLLKYNWIEKTITATVLTWGYLQGDIPIRLMLLITFTNWLWIPVVLWADIAMRRELRQYNGGES